MKPIYREVLLAAILGLVLPMLVLHVALKMDDGPATVATIAPEESANVEGATIDTDGRANKILLRQGDAVAEKGLEEYLVGVLLAELPASFEKEAKKAQAVVARTYAWKAWTTGGKHGDGSVCVDPACCQSYIAPEVYVANGGSREAVTEAETAVRETAGYVLMYDGSLIEATYFSCSGGRTEDAVAVWGSDFPYLRATDSPGEENAAHYTDTVSFSKGDFCNRLGVSLGSDPDNWVGYTTYTAGGGVNTMRIGGKDLSGTELRRLLGLRSTAFTIEIKDGMIYVVTRGYGHRVGMSQYGADAMAVAGKDFKEILEHYYRGTQLGSCQPKQN